MGVGVSTGERGAHHRPVASKRGAKSWHRTFNPFDQDTMTIVIHDKMANQFQPFSISRKLWKPFGFMGSLALLQSDGNDRKRANRIIDLKYQIADRFARQPFSESFRVLSVEKFR